MNREEGLKNIYRDIVRNELKENEYIVETCSDEQLDLVLDVLTRWFGKSTAYQQITPAITGVIERIIARDR